jgi:hypothetical protein
MWNRGKQAAHLSLITRATAVKVGKDPAR